MKALWHTLDLVRETGRLDWSQLTPAEGFRLVPAMALALFAGLAFDATAAGAIAASGAMVVGLGRFQQFTRSRVGPMIFAALGMGASTFLGTLVGQSTLTMAAATLVMGFWCGLLPAIGMGAFWVGQQCIVFLLIAGAYGGGVGPAAARAGLVLAGGAAQIAVLAVIVTIERRRVVAPGLGGILADARTALSGLALQVRLRAAFFRFAIRISIVLCAAVVAERLLAIPNGYWVAMTTLLLMRPDFHDVLARSLGRVAGTVGGAVLATVVAIGFAPGDSALAALVACFAFLAYATLRLNFGVFSLFFTAYVVLLLSLAGLVEPRVAQARIESTVIGGAFALAAHIDFYLIRRPGGRRGPAARR